MKAFKHFNAASVSDAVNKASSNHQSTSFIAGGTDLLGVLKSEILSDSPKALINLKTIPGLDVIEKKDDQIRMGSLCLLTDIAESEVLAQTMPSLCQAAAKVAFPEIRNMGTIGGNLCQDTRCWYYRYPGRMGGQIPCYRKGKGPCHAIKGDNRYHAILGGKKCFAACPSDIAISLGALDAVVAATGPDGNRNIPVIDFFTVTGNVLNPGEIVERIDVPIPAGKGHQVFLKNSIRKSIDFATASVAVKLEITDDICTDVRIVLGAVAPYPFRATAAEKEILNKPLNPVTIANAAKASVSGARPLSRNGYKIQITRELVKQGLTI